jgi:hypothetical protein
MKLLAAFDDQLSGLDGDDDDDGDGDSLGDAAVQESRGQNVVRFKRNRLHLSGLNFTMLNVHLYQDDEPRFAVGVNIANTTLVGQFQYDGYAPAVSFIGPDYSKLAGHYRMSIDNILLTAASNLTKVQVPTTTPDAKYKYKLASNGLRMNISNLGYISIEILDAKDSSRPTSNYVLKMLQRVLQKTIKRTYNKFEDYIRQTLELEGRQFLDCELTRFSPLLTENQRDYKPPAGLAANERQTKAATAAATTDGMVSPNGTDKGGQQTMVMLQPNGTYLQDLAKIISTEIANSHLDRIRLPDFDYQRTVFGSSADISFQNGSLDGLDNIKLNGETRVKLLEEHLLVNASVGWFDLRPHYNWTLYFGSSHEDEQTATSGRANSTSEQQQQAAAAGDAQRVQTIGSGRPMARGFVAFSIKAVDFDAVVSRSTRSQSQMVVDELTIRRLDTPKMDIGGLPGMNRLTRAAVNFFMGRLKQRLVSSVQPTLKRELERALNRLALFN